ncbi:MAG: TonB family protein [Sulfurovaceae bacterium]|nr:TonB family protein [Sulfurovaceae bacterium]
MKQLQKSQPQNNPCCCSTKPKQERPKTVSKNPTAFQKAKQISKPKQEKSVSISNKQSTSLSKQYAIPQETSDIVAPNKIDSSAFEAMIKNRIIQNKFYPLIAKNAGIEGVVNASFVILPNGNVGEISVNGSNALKSAAREAIYRAFPIDVRNCPVNLPITMHISLRYSLVE